MEGVVGNGKGVLSPEGRVEGRPIRNGKSGLHREKWFQREKGFPFMLKYSFNTFRLFIDVKLSKTFVIVFLMSPSNPISTNDITN